MPVKQLIPSDDIPSLSPENGYGLFDRTVVQNTLPVLADSNETDYLLSEEKLLSLCVPEEELLVLFDQLNAVFDLHRDFEYTYENYAKERKTILFGDAEGLLPSIRIPIQYGNDFTLKAGRAVTFDMIPFGDEFLEILAPWISNTKKILILVWGFFQNDCILGPADVLPWFRDFRRHFRCFSQNALNRR